MHADSLLQLLEQKNLLSVAKRYKKVFEKVLSKAMNVKTDILLITDFGTKDKRIAPVMTYSYFLAAESLGCEASVVVRSKDNSKIVSEMKKLDRKSTAILNVSNKLSIVKELGRSFRSFAKLKGCKFVTTSGLGSLPTTGIFNIISPFDINYEKLKRQSSIIKRKLDLGRKVKVTTKAGTSLEIDIRGKTSIPIDGNYKNFPSGGNMPAGEVYLAPVKGAVNGTVVIDGSSRLLNGTVKIQDPIILKMRNGMLHTISGGKEAKLLKASLCAGMRQSSILSNVKRVSEFGIGLNPKSKIYGAMVIDEKALGTAHIALGSNHWFGGDVHSALHLDQVFREPEIQIDGKPLQLPKRKDLL